MATGTGPLDAQDIFNKVWNPAGTGPSPTGDSFSVYLVPGSGQATPVLGSGTAQGLGPNPLVVVQPAFRQVLLHSGAITGSGTGTATTGIGGYKVLDIYVRATTGSGTASTLDIFVESRLDGTNWVTVGHFAQVTSALAGTYDRALRLSAYQGLASAISADEITLRTDPGAGTVRQIGWGNDVRIRRDVSGGTTNPSFTYTVTMNARS